MGYTTLTDQYYRAIPPQQLLDGARVGMVAYLHGRGITDPHVPLLRARRDGRGIVPAIEQQLGKSIARYGARVDPRAFVYETIRGEIGALHDPYSVFFTQAEVRGFTTALDGTSFGGVGIIVAADSAGRYHADSIFDQSPAARAGIEPGDRILGIDGKRPDGLTSEAIARLLRGPVGTVVRVDISRDGVDGPVHLNVTRAIVTPPDVTARSLTPGIGYLALRSFGPTAGDQVKSALSRLRAHGARAIVFDLRGNGGGYESSAVHVASAFVPAGPIVATRAKHGRRQVTFADGTAGSPLPLAVLVDGDSASGSELVTGAIQDHGLGKVVGVRTFGKGLVQTMFPLPDGSAMKVTTARYYTPNGRDIDRVGIAPDVVVAEPTDAQRGLPGHDAQLDAARALLDAIPAR